MALQSIAGLIALLARALAALGFLFALAVALTHWATRRGTLTPFGAWPRFVRRASDPLLRRVERRIVQSGGNPQDAPGWLFAGSVVAGLILIASVDWALGFVLGLVLSLQQGVGLVMLVDTLFSALMGALVIRVVASFLGISPYARWMRPVRWCTDWILEPLRRLLPTVGPLDFSPMAAWFLLSLLRTQIIRALL